MAQSSNVFQLEKLNSCNYFTWAVYMQQFLKKEGLWTCVNNPLAVAPTPAQAIADSKALATIVLSLDSTHVAHVAHVQSAKEAWDILQQLYVGKGAGSLISLVRRMYRCYKAPEETMANHLARMAQFFQQLAQRGKVLSEQDKAFAVLTSLDSSYDTLITALEALDANTLTLGVVSGHLLEEEARRAESRISNQFSRMRVQEGAVPRSEGSVPKQLQQPSQGERALRVRKCYGCGSTQHLQAACTAGRSRAKKKKKSQSEAGFNGSCSRVGSCYQSSVAVVTEAPVNQTWLLDSGASLHYVHQENLLQSKRDPGVTHVSMANGQTAHVACQGEVWFPALNCTLTNVLCIPELQNNLLSVGELDKAGYEITFADAECAISQGGQVLLRGKKKENVYVVANVTNGKVEPV